MKKTVKILASLLAFMLLLTGCASNAAESDPKSQPSDSSESTPIEVKKLTGGTELELKPELKVRLIGLYNNKLLLCKSVQDTDEDGEYLDTGSDIYYTYDISTGEKTDVGKMAYVSSSAGDYVMMGDQRVYNALTGGNPMGQIFFSLGLEGGKEKIIEKDESNTFPLCFLSPLNDDEIIINNYCVLQAENDICEYRVRKYNVRTGVFTELIKTEYNRTKGRGKAVSIVSCYNNKIHVYALDFKGKGEYKSYIEIYNTNGELLEACDAELIEKETSKNEDSVWEIGVYGNCYVAGTLNGNSYIFVKEGNEFRKVAEAPGYTFMTTSMKGSNKIPEYVLLTSWPNKEIRLFDVKEQKLYAFELSLDNECKYYNAWVIDDKGNFVFELSSSDHYDENAVLKYYYLSAEEIKKQLA